MGNHRHGHKKQSGASREYATWNNIWARCTNPKLNHYKRYGGRGITVCKRWERFENFLADMGAHPGAGYSIERIENDKGYTPGNCRWATRKEQANNRRSNRILTHNGEEKTMTQWAEKMGIQVSTLHARLKDGWSIERAISQAVR